MAKKDAVYGQTLVLSPGRLLNAYIDKRDVGYENSSKKYGTQIAWKKDSLKNDDRFAQLRDEVLRICDTFGVSFDDLAHPPFKDGDGTNSVGKEYSANHKGCVFIQCYNDKNRPEAFVLSDDNELVTLDTTEEVGEEIYSGCYATCLVQPVVFPNKGGTLGFIIHAVTKVDDGIKVGGSGVDARTQMSNWAQTFAGKSYNNVDTKKSKGSSTTVTSGGDIDEILRQS